MAYVKTEWQDGVSGNTPINATNLNNIEDGIESNDTRISEVYEDMYYNANDTFEISTPYLNCAGMLSGGQKGVYFTIPVDKSMKKITTATIESSNVQIRHADGGYIAQNVSLASLGTLSVSKISDRNLSVVLTLTNAASQTNNSVITVSINSITISFS